MAKAAETETTEAEAHEGVQALTGSGGKKVEVRANVTYGDLAAGTTGYVDDTPDTRKDIDAGYIETV